MDVSKHIYYKLLNKIINDGTVTGSKMVTSEYIYETQFLPIQKIAQKYGVGFMLGETAEPNGVDTKSVYDFTDTLLKPLYENKIAWANANLCTRHVFEKTSSGLKVVRLVYQLLLYTE